MSDPDPEDLLLDDAEFCAFWKDEQNNTVPQGLQRVLAARVWKAARQCTPPQPMGNLRSISLVQALATADKLYEKHMAPDAKDCFKDIKAVEAASLITAFEVVAREAWEQHGCIRNSCSSCDFCWGHKGKTDEPQLYSSACDFCKAYYERLTRGAGPP